MKKTSGEAAAQARRIVDGKTKPLGSLGKLEDIVVRLAGIQDRPKPVAEPAAMLVFAADHGVCEEGVSAFPQAVTAQMVQNFVGGGAAISVLCRNHGIEFRVVDAGVAWPLNTMGKNEAPSELAASPLFMSETSGRGTANFRRTRAMTREQAAEATEHGRKAFKRLSAELGGAPAILGLGEMGIGNTTSAAAIVAAACGRPAAECTGRGTGIGDEALAHKIRVIEDALNLHKPDTNDVLDLLSAVGGYEIAAMAGAALEAAEQGCAVVLDGLISTAAGLIAAGIDPGVKDYMFASHKSVERGHTLALEKLGLEALFDLGMRLGEGSGAALAINLIRSAAFLQRDMASFDQAGVSEKL